MRQLKVLSSVLLVAFAPYIPAQQGDDPILEEVVVTATKREGSQQDVAGSILVVDGDFLAGLQSNSVQDLAQFAPNLTWQDQVDAKGQAISIRGVGTATLNDGIEDSVGVVVDDVVMGRTAMGLNDLYDIERVEVLRGPQGTLFGKSSSAGVLNITTKGPNTERFDLSATASYADYDLSDERKFEGAISGPVNDAVAYRLAAYSLDRGGLLYNVTRDKKVNDKEQWGLRGKLLLQPSESFDVMLSADYMDDKGECCHMPLVRIENRTPSIPFPPFLNFGVTGAIAVEPLFPIHEGNRLVADSTPWASGNEVWGGSVKLNYVVAEHTLTSISAYRNWKHFKLADVDHSPLGLTDGVNRTDGITVDTEFEQLTQELRFASPTDKRYDYLAGIHFYDQQTRGVEQFHFSFETPVELETMYTELGVDVTAVGAFASGTYRFTDSLNVQGGLRYNYQETKGFVDHQELGPIALFAPFTAADSEEDEHVLGRIAVQYDFRPDLMAFVNYATGYKGQAADILSIQNVTLTGDLIIPAETSEEISVGLKSRWLNGRLQANVTFFHSIFEDFQAENWITPPGGVPGTKLSSVNELRSQGAELELLVGAMDNLQFGANLGYMDAEFTDHPNAPCYELQTEAQGCSNGTQDLTNRPLPAQGDWQYNAFFNFEHTLTERIGLVLSGNYAYIGDRYTLWNLDPRSKVDSVGLLNARVGLRFGEGRYEVGLFGRNLTDEEYTTRRSYSAIAGAQTRLPGVERSVGVMLSARL